MIACSALVLQAWHFLPPLLACSLRCCSRVLQCKHGTSERTMYAYDVRPRQVEMDVREYLDQVRIEATVKAVDMSDVKFNREVYREHQEHRQENQALSNMGVR